MRHKWTPSRRQPKEVINEAYLRELLQVNIRHRINYSNGLVALPLDQIRTTLRYSRCLDLLHSSED